jgi:hypothetical protein
MSEKLAATAVVTPGFPKDGAYYLLYTLQQTRLTSYTLQNNKQSKYDAQDKTKQ